MSAARPATLTPSLLGLGSELLETILGQLPQDERQRTLPLVCKQLDSLLKGSPRLWNRLTLTLASGAPGCKPVQCGLASSLGLALQKHGG